MPTGLAGCLLASIIAVAYVERQRFAEFSGSQQCTRFSALRFGNLGSHKPANDAGFLRLSRRMTLFWDWC